MRNIHICLVVLLSTALASICLTGCSKTQTLQSEKHENETNVIFGIPNYSSIREAIAEGDIESVKAFIESDPNVLLSESDRCQLLCTAAETRKTRIVEYLLQKGVSSKDRKSNNTVLHVFARERWALIPGRIGSSYDIESMKTILKSGADINAVDSEGYTPLHIAALYNRDNFEVIKFLIENGADINAKSYVGFTPLSAYYMYPSKRDRIWEENPEIISTYLLDHGADVNVRDLSGRASLDYVAASSKQDERFVKIVEQIIDKGAKSGARLPKPQQVASKKPVHTPDSTNSTTSSSLFSSGIESLREKAEQGDPVAQHNLGGRYFDGNGVEKDYRSAFKWTKMSAEQGLLSSQKRLATCYFEGVGVEKDLQEAVKWFRQAAEQGDADSQLILGSCYSVGQGVERNFEEAEKWYRKAANQGNSKARELLEQLKELKSTIQRPLGSR